MYAEFPETRRTTSLNCLLRVLDRFRRTGSRPPLSSRAAATIIDRGGVLRKSGAIFVGSRPSRLPGGDRPTPIQAARENLVRRPREAGRPSSSCGGSSSSTPSEKVANQVQQTRERRIRSNDLRRRLIHSCNLAGQKRIHHSARFGSGLKLR